MLVCTSLDGMSRLDGFVHLVEFLSLDFPILIIQMFCSFFFLYVIPPATTTICMQEKYEEATASLAEMEKRVVMAESMLEATLQYQSGQVKAQPSPRYVFDFGPFVNMILLLPLCLYLLQHLPFYMQLPPNPLPTFSLPQGGGGEVLIYVGYQLRNISVLLAYYAPMDVICVILLCLCNLICRSPHPDSSTVQSNQEAQDFPARKISLLSRPFGIGWRDRSKVSFYLFSLHVHHSCLKSAVYLESYIISKQDTNHFVQ